MPTFRRRTTQKARLVHPRRSMEDSAAIPQVLPTPGSTHPPRAARELKSDRTECSATVQGPCSCSAVGGWLTILALHSLSCAFPLYTATWGTEACSVYGLYAEIWFGRVARHRPSSAHDLEVAHDTLRACLRTGDGVADGLPVQRGPARQMGGSRSRIGDLDGAGGPHEPEWLHGAGNSVLQCGYPPGGRPYEFDHWPAAASVFIEVRRHT